jgi:hypothetical protein
MYAMSDLQLLTKLSALPPHLQAEVADFIDFLSQKQLVGQDSKSVEENARRPIRFGLAKGKIRMKKNFDDPIPGFEEYMP